MSRRAPRAAEDEEEEEVKVVGRRAAPRPAGAGDADEAPAARRRAAPPAAHEDPTADASASTVVRRRTNATTADATATPSPASGAAASAPSQAAAAAASSASAAADYDSMTYAQFVSHLQQQTRDEALKAAAARKAGQKNGGVDDEARSVETYPDGAGGYSYNVLLDRVYHELHLKNPHLSGGEATRSQLPQPLIEKHGAKKTAVGNFQAICDAMHRTLDEVKDYIDKELSTQSALDGNNCLLLKLQNVKSNQFENVLLKYVSEFVKCEACKKIDTELIKDVDRRMQVLKCNNCKAERNVKSSSQGFKAETGKRSKARLAGQL